MSSGVAARGADGPALTGDAATPGKSVSEVVVTGKRATTKDGALLEKREDIAVTDIMSAEEIAERPGASIADVISHLPGLSTFSDMGLGQASTGQAEYVTIRGIDSSYNAYTLNGVRVPQADPDSRALSLKLVAPYGLEAVKVVKTPTPDMDGDAIGGAIDIRTPNAFDFSGPMARATVQGDLSGLANGLGARSEGGGGQIELARKFGASETFGVYLGGYYSRTNSAGEAVEALGYVPTQRAQEPASLQGGVVNQGTTQTDLAAATDGLSATGIRYDYYNNDITRFGGNLSLDYVAGAQKLYLEAAYAGYKDVSYDTQHSLIGALSSAYGPTGTSDTFDPIGVLPGSYWQSRSQNEQLATFKLGGETRLDRLTVSYDGSVGYSDIAEPNYVQASLYGFPSLSGGYSVNLANPARTANTFDSAGAQTYALSQSTDSLWKYQGQTTGSSNLMYGGKIDAHYRIEQGVLDSLQAGLDINVADRSQYNHPFFTNGPFGFGGSGNNYVILGAGGVVEPFYAGAGPTVANLPGYNISFGGGNYPGAFKIYTPSYFNNAVLPLAYTSQFGAGGAPNPGAYTSNDYNGQTVNGDEDVYAGYAEAQFKYQAWSALVGVRYEETSVSYSQWMDETATTGAFQTTSRSYAEVLPSALVTWRPDESMVLRADIRESFARPAFGLIASPINVSVNALTNQITGASEGNPNLKPATALNYDVDFEKYGRHGDFFEVNAYYKDIHNFIYPATVSGGLPSTATGSQTVNGLLVSLPENGKGGYLFGAELDVRRKLVELPGVLGGFGLGAALTLQHSSANPNLPGHAGDTWLPRAPEIIYNLDLFYEKYRIRSDLSFQYTGEQLDGISSTNLDEYLQPEQSLDFSISYPFYGVVVALAAKNLLDDIEFYKTLAKGTQYLGVQDGGGNGSWVQTGRFFTLSASYRW